MIAWHYTTAQKYQLIQQSRLLLPAHIGVAYPERPILWFSTNQAYEPTALKPLSDDRGNIIRMLSVKELYDMAGGLVRLGCSVRALKQGDNLRKASRMPLTIWKHLQQTGKRQKANPADWWGHIGTMPLEEVTVEIMDTNMVWRSAIG